MAVKRSIVLLPMGGRAWATPMRAVSVPVLSVAEGLAQLWNGLAELLEAGNVIFGRGTVQERVAVGNVARVVRC